jgi:hypothetical protein
LTSEGGLRQVRWGVQAVPLRHLEVGEALFGGRWHVRQLWAMRFVWDRLEHALRARLGVFGLARSVTP